MPTISSIAVAAVLLCSSAATAAAEWSDTSLSWRIGKRFGEPFNPLPKYGSNFFNVDLLHSDGNDPGSLTPRGGAQETYLGYRHMFDIGKLRATGLAFGVIAGVGTSAGAGWNTSNDVAYNARKRMLVAGPTLMWKAPGFVQASVLLLHESNAPGRALALIADVRGPYTYKLQPMLTASWGVPLGLGFRFEGYANLIAAQGRDQAGPETNIDMQLMYDLGAAMGSPKNLFRIGLQYQFWNNKFGNTSTTTTGGRGQRASTPMIRADVHF